MTTTDTLIFGWGNPSRRDDGLGPALAERVAALELPGVTVETDFQLHVEDAAELALHERVVFVDAARRGDGPFWIRRGRAEGDGLSFTTHSVSPGALLTLARRLFLAEPEAWVLGIRGYDFDDFGEGLSELAAGNLDEAVAFIEAAVRDDSFREIRPPEGSSHPFHKDREGEPCQTTSP